MHKYWQTSCFIFQWWVLISSEKMLDADWSPQTPGEPDFTALFWLDDHMLMGGVCWEMIINWTRITKQYESEKTKLVQVTFHLKIISYCSRFRNHKKISLWIYQLSICSEYTVCSLFSNVMFIYSVFRIKTPVPCESQEITNNIFNHSYDPLYSVRQKSDIFCKCEVY